MVDSPSSSDKKYTSTTKSIMEQLRVYDESIALKLRSIIFNDSPDKVLKWHDLFKDPLFYPKQNMSLDEMRAIAYKRLKKVADAKLFSIYDFINDPKNLLTAHEMLSFCDGALATKFTV